MKLYATVSSERASKGQGGNDFLFVEVKGEGGEKIFEMTFKPTNHGYCMEGYAIHTIRGRRSERFMTDEWYEEDKGERQKGECVECKATATLGDYCQECADNIPL